MAYKGNEPFRIWAVLEDCAICHITVPGAAYLSTDVRYSLDEYKKIMEYESRQQKPRKRRTTQVIALQAMGELR